MYDVWKRALKLLLVAISSYNNKSEINKVKLISTVHDIAQLNSVNQYEVRASGENGTRARDRLRKWLRIHFRSCGMSQAPAEDKAFLPGAYFFFTILKLILIMQCHYAVK